jgi:Domain of unknown function (DUF4397)
MRFKALFTARWLVAIAAIAVLPLACAPKPDSTDKAAASSAHEEHALVRFVNATTYTEPVDVYLDEAKVLPEVSRDRVTDYSEWKANRHEIEVRVAGNVSSSAKDSENLGAQEHYTVVGFSKADGTPGVAVFHDSDSQPEAGKARIRLIHVADGAAELGVFPAGGKDSLLDGVNYSDESSADVDPGIRMLEIRKEGEKVVAVKIPEVSLQAGKTYTIVIAADQDRKLRAIQLNNTGLQQGSIR